MRMILLSAAALALAGLASPSVASGSGSGGGGGGGFGTFGASGNSTQNREAQRLFRQGRSQVRKRITCKECDYHKRLNKSNARQVAQEVIEGKFGIDENDRTAVLIYLRNRYDL